VLIDQAAYSNRWRQVHPAAKVIFSFSGMVAAFLAGPPWSAGALALALALITVGGAGIPAGHYLRAAAPALFFLGISALALLVSVTGMPGTGNGPVIVVTDAGREQAVRLCGRAVVSLAALLFLALTTPLTEIIALLRSLKVPGLVLDMAVIGYRMLFVFSDTVHQIRTAQAARLGYAGRRHAFRSLGQLVAASTLQIWQRAAALDRAAEARCSNGSLRFMTPLYAHTPRDLVIALSAGTFLIMFSLVAL
jgi:cobalt/nickel transport system permease protein